MKKYLNVQKIFQRWDIKKIELFDLVKEGLQPYSPDTCSPVPCYCTIQKNLKGIKSELAVIEKFLKSPKSLTRREEDYLIEVKIPISQLKKVLNRRKEVNNKALKLIDQSPEGNEDSWIFFCLDGQEQLKKKVIDGLFKKALFLKSDVSKIIASKKRNNLNNQNYEYSFSREGEFWNVRFGEEKTSLKNRERLRYLIHLLDNPNKEFYPHELISLVKGEIDQYQKDINDASLDQEGLSITELHIESLSEKESDAFENLVYDAWDDLMRAEESGNAKRESDAREKFKKVKKYLFNAYGIKVIPSAQGLRFNFLARLSKDAEKSRTNVQKHISNSKKDIKIHLPSLATHLDNHIKTGMKCSYQLDPEDPIKWHIRL